MLITIKKDDATSVSREVADLAEAQQVARAGLPVFIQHKDGSTEAVSADEPVAEESPSEPPPAEPEVEVPAEPQTPSDEPAQG